MKKLITFLSISLFFLGACNSEKSGKHDAEEAHEHTTGTHTHEDGSEHADHEDTTAKQEEFTVGADSTVTTPGDTASGKKPHSHDGSREHSH